MSFKEISIDIIHYLQSNKGLSIDDVAKATGTTSQHIQEILNEKSFFKEKQIDFYMKQIDIPLWEFLYEAVPMEHLPKKIKNKIKLCKEISEVLKKRKK
jgi:hypothetical protein